MVESDENPISGIPFVIIVGPTAVGKTEIALQVAGRVNGEIVSADSRLFYRGMDIGTAKPSLAERERIPHHLIDIADPDQVLSLAVYQRMASEAVRDIHQRQRLPILVGGTGQYIRAITESWDMPRIEPNQRMREVLAQWVDDIGAEGLHARLAAIDPDAAGNIDWRNVRRTIRALEVIFISGRRFTAQRKRIQPPRHILQIGLTRPRSELFERIDRRIQLMLDAGFVDEVRRLLARGYSKDLPTLSAIGYREIISYIQGTSTLDEAVVAMKRKTRIYVRRQANWFKQESAEIRWYQVDEQTVDQLSADIQAWLSASKERV